MVEGDISQIGAAILRWKDEGVNVRVIRGGKSRPEKRLMDECAAALQFPLFFGENRDAMDECLSELEGLPADRAVLLVMTEPDEILADEPPSSLTWFVASLKYATETWNTPIADGQWWDRGARDFSVVLVGGSACLARARERWMTAGARPEFCE